MSDTNHTSPESNILHPSYQSRARQFEEQRLKAEYRTRECGESGCEPFHTALAPCIRLLDGFGVHYGAEAELFGCMYSPVIRVSTF
jgi:hypothetical protein